jgi:hypothetical protein
MRSCCLTGSDMNHLVPARLDKAVQRSRGV